MVKIPYGGVNAREYDRNLHDTDPQKAWVNLKTVHEYLYDGQPVPPVLAWWLGGAITQAMQHVDTDPQKAVREFTRALGLTLGPGGTDSQDMRWLVYGSMIDELEEDGVKIEAALEETRDAMVADLREPVSNTMLKKWRDKYREARRITASINDEHHREECRIHDEECRRLNDEACRDRDNSL